MELAIRPGTLIGLVVRVAICAAACGVLAPAWATEKKAFDIPAESADLSVRQFVEQADMSILYSSGRLTPFYTRALKGDHEPIDALRLLLAGSGLGFTMINPRVVSIDPISAPTRQPASDAPAQEELPTVRVLTAQSNDSGFFRFRGDRLVTVSSADLQASSFNSLSGWAHSLGQNQGSGATEDTHNFLREAPTNTAIGEGINLYGLGQRSTLVLVNGRPLAPSGSAGSFTDISNIPLSAVDHIDFIPLSASSVYGVDAAGGVINLVLIGPSSRPATTLSRGHLTGESVEDTRISQSVTQHWGDVEGIFSAEYFNRSNLSASSRIQGTSNLAPRGTNFDSIESDPATIVDSLGRIWGVPHGQDGTHLTSSQLLPHPNQSDRVAGTWLLPRQQRMSLVENATYSLQGGGTLYWNSLVNRRWVDNVQAPMTAVLSVPSTNAFYLNPVPGNSSPLTVDYNFGRDLGPIVVQGEVNSAQFAMGFDQPVSPAWTLHGYTSYSYEDQHIVQHNMVNFGALRGYLASADAGTAFNPFGDGSHTARSTLEAIRLDGSLKYGSAITNADLSISGSIPVYSVGPMALTAGFDYRVQSFESTLSPSSGSWSSVETPATDRNRAVDALFVQSSIDLQRLPFRSSVSGGVRYEHFSDMGSAATPSVGFELQPVSTVSISGTWAKFFRAPNLQDLNESSNVSAILPVADHGAYTSTLVWTGNNAALRPESARDWTFGGTWTPYAVPDLSMTITYWNIASSHRIAPIKPLASTVLTDPLYRSDITRYVPATERAYICTHSQFLGTQDECLASAIGALVDLRLDNSETLATDGLDFSDSYSIATLAGIVSANVGVVMSCISNSRSRPEPS